MGKVRRKGKTHARKRVTGVAIRSAGRVAGEEQMDKCKVCGYEIIIGGRYADQVAQTRGFCGAGCEDVYEAQKAADMKAAANA